MVQLEVGDFVIGRGAEVDLALGGMMVSRRHCTIRIKEDGTAVLRDEHSRNGVLVNGHPVQVTKLQHRDRITVGTHELIFQTTPEEPSSSRVSRATLPVSREESTAHGSVYEMFIGVATRALQEDDLDSAEIATRNLLMAVRSSAVRGRMLKSAFDGCIDLTLTMAARTGDERWVDRLLNLHDSAGLPVSEQTQSRIDDLERSDGG